VIQAAPGAVADDAGVVAEFCFVAYAAEQAALFVFRQVGDERFFETEFFADTFLFHGGTN